MLAKIDSSWHDFFNYQKEQAYFQKLETIVSLSYQNKKCTPEFNDIFNIFKLIKLSQIKVVIIGQDPYPGLGIADGIAFSCKKETAIPPTLRNIFKELINDLNIDHFNNLSLVSWVTQGVFLINTSWSVYLNLSDSHANFGWKNFTINLLNYINKYNNNLIYLCWGNNAKKLIQNLVNINYDNIITNVHPSPLSSYKGFFNSKPFSKINQKLLNLKIEPISWEQ